MDQNKVTMSMSGVGRLGMLEQVPPALKFLSDSDNVAAVEWEGYSSEKRRVHVELARTTKSVKGYLVQDHFPSQVLEGFYEIISKPYTPRQVRRMMDKQN